MSTSSTLLKRADLSIVYSKEIGCQVLKRASTQPNRTMYTMYLAETCK